MASTTKPVIAPQVMMVDRSLTNSVRQRRLTGKIVTYILLTVSGLMFAFPLFWTASSSLQTWQELRSYTPHWLPSEPQWSNYADVFEAAPFGRWLGNSFLIVLITIPGTLITATMTAYAFARFNFVGKQFWFILMLGTMMIPATVTLIPQYLLWFKLKMINTYVPLTIGRVPTRAAITSIDNAAMIVWFRPSKIAGRAKGTFTCQSSWRGVAPICRADSTISGRTLRKPCSI